MTSQTLFAFNVQLTRTPTSIFQQILGYSKHLHAFQLPLTNQNVWCFCIFFKATMTQLNIPLFTVFLLTVLTNTVEVDNNDSLTNKLCVSHNDCSKKQKIHTYTFNQVPECKITPENFFWSQSPLLYIGKAIEQLYQQQCVLLRYIFSVLIVDWFTIPQFCMIKIRSRTHCHT